MRCACWSTGIAVCSPSPSQGTDVDTRGSLGDTALHWAARGGHVAAIETLLQKGADIAAANNQGDTALHLAAFKNHVDACKKLVAMGANREALNKQNQRPLDMARSVPIKVVVAPEEDDCEGYSGSGSDSEGF